MPVRSASSVSVTPRWARSCLSRGPTWSRARRDRDRGAHAAIPPRASRKRQPSLSGRGRRAHPGMDMNKLRRRGRRWRRRRPVRRPGPVPRPPQRRSSSTPAQPRNAPAAHMQGFLSRDGMPPADLLATGRREVTRLRRHRRGTAPSTELVRCDGSRLPGRCSPTAAASRPAGCSSPPGCATSCPTSPDCASAGHATSCTARTATATRSATSRSASSVARPDTVRYAQIVRQWTDDVVLFAPGETPHRRGPGTSWSRAPSASSRAASRRLVVEDDALRGVEMADGRVIPRDALFVPPRLRPAQRPAGRRSAASSTSTAGCAPTPPARTSVPGAVGRRQRRQPPRPGHHRRRRRLRRRHRHQRRPGRRRRPHRRRRLPPRPFPTQGSDDPDPRHHRTTTHLTDTHPPTPGDHHAHEPTHTAPPRARRPADQAPARPHDLAVRLPDADRHQPRRSATGCARCRRCCAPSSWPRSPCPSSSTA